MSYFDPLEQFSIEIYNSNLFINESGRATSLGSAIFGVFTVMWMYVWTDSQNTFLTDGNEKSQVILFNFVKSSVMDSLSVKKYSFILLMYVVFLFIFLSNILGMIPYSITITSHLILTLYFSLAFFMGNNLIGMCFHKEKYFVLFLPEGVPVMVMPFLILIEYVSYISSIFSLAMSLFANMMSGHILLKILISFIWAMLMSNLMHWSWILLPLFIVFMVIGLETVMAFLQAYVFMVLLSIYLNDTINTH